MSEAALVVDQVTKSYGDFNAVNNVSLSVNKGEAIALLGHNGAGKTTLFKLAQGLIKPTSGTVSITCKKSDIGYLPENISFYDQMSAEETLVYYARLKNAPLKQVNGILELVGLAPFQKRRIRTYSKGMRQRLGFAQALLGNPSLLFLDEPTGGLDPVGREELFEIINKLICQGTSVVFSSHVLRELENKVEKIAIMHSGNLIANDTLDNLRRQSNMPSHINLKISDKAQMANWEIYLSSFADSGTKILNKSNDTFYISCSDKVKKAFILYITACDLSFEDIDVLPLSLADIYIKMCQDQNSEQSTQKIAV